jgi:hypothetical protein
MVFNVQISVIPTNARRGSNARSSFPISRVINVHPHNIFFRSFIVKDMRTFYYAIGAKIARALEGEELVYEGPLYEILGKRF